MNIIFFSDAGNATFKRIFSGRGHCFFCQKGNATFVTLMHIYRKYHISMYFLIKIIFFHFPLRKNYHISRKKEIPYFQILQKIPCSGANFLGRPSFQNIWKKHHISKYCFWERSSFFLHLKNKIIFREKEISSSLIIQKRSYFSTIFLERPSLQNIWKKKTRFFVQWSLIGNVFVAH